MAALRPVAWSAVVSAAFAVVIATPALAEPPNIPDSGTRPNPSSELRLPGLPPTSAPPAYVAPVPGPLAAQIMTAETEVAVLGERVKGIGEQVAAAREATIAAEESWREAQERLTELRASADAAVEEAYKTAAQLHLFGPFGSDLRDLGRLLPRINAQEQPEATPWDIARAEEDERSTFRIYGDAQLLEQGLTSQYATLDGQRRQREAALLKLKQDNAAQLAQIEAVREEYERNQARLYPLAGTNTAGQAAHPKSLEAVRFALKQLGKPYEWGAEGPNRFDCSGLVWAAYKSVGKTLQRVANNQYHTTRPVTVDKLLPGDLVFFATNRSDWTSIHHVGIYLGGGKMVHAPTTGDVVKISNVWWSRFFGATRVFDEVPAPPPPSPTPSPTRPPSSPPSSPPSEPPPSSPPSEPPPSEPASEPPPPRKPPPSELASEPVSQAPTAPSTTTAAPTSPSSGTSSASPSGSN